MEHEFEIDSNGRLDISRSNLDKFPEYLLDQTNEIIELYCYDNNLTSLPDLPNCEDLFCGSNRLTKYYDHRYVYMCLNGMYKTKYHQFNEQIKYSPMLPGNIQGLEYLKVQNDINNMLEN